MPGKARIDAPGALHHIIVRGIKRRRIFSDDQDRDNFIERPGDIAAGIKLCPREPIDIEHIVSDSAL